MPSLGPAHRQIILWRLVAATFAGGLKADPQSPFERLARELLKTHPELQLPEDILDPGLAIPTLLQRHPHLRAAFDAPMPGLREEAADEEQEDGAAPQPVAAAPEPAADETARARRALVFSKLLLNTLGPLAQTPTVSAQQYQQWTKDMARLEQSFGYPPGSLRGKGGDSEGGGPRLFAEEDLRAGFASMDSDLIRRMALREVLKDNRLCQELKPSMALVEQLLIDKANLSDEALANAKRLIRAYVDQLAEVLRLKVAKAKSGKIDRSVPPKRVFRNLDIKRTIWRNLVNWDAAGQRLLVDRLYFRRTARKVTPTRLLVVVDQSGSMVDAMVQSTILASIFSGLPNVDVHLLAFDTRVLDLTPWVHDPFEVLMRTQLGGGTLIYQALLVAQQKIVEPRDTALVLISDFFEGGSDQVLLDGIKAIKDSGVHFIPVGALQSTGYFSVCDFFKQRLKELGTPILSGSITKLIAQLRYLLN